MSNVLIFSESFKTFVGNKKDTNKVCKALYGYLDNNRFDGELRIKAYELMIVSDDVNYITFRNNGMISYLPKGKEHLVNDDKSWKKENRQEGKPAKVIRKLFTDNALKMFKESDFETFNNVYKSHFNTDLSFELLDSIEIPNVYDMERNGSNGSLNNSCMNGDTNYLRIYAKCESLQILILKNKDGLLCGRALIWSVENVKIMDRIYISDDYITELFFDYANKNGMIRKKEQSYSNKTSLIGLDGKEFDKYYKIYTDTDFSYYPYIDTFTYGDDGFLTNECGHNYTYDNTNGSRDGDCNDDDDDDENRMYDEIDECYIDDDDAVQIEYGTYRDRYTHVNNTVSTVDGSIYWINSTDICTLYNGDVVEIYNAIYCEYNCDYYLADECTKVDNGEYANMFVHQEYVIIDINDETWFINDDEIVLIDDVYYPKDSDLISCIDGVYILSENLELEIA